MLEQGGAPHSGIFDRQGAQKKLMAHELVSG